MPMIVVVDDDQQIRTWLRQILEGKGYDVREAKDGYEALAYLERDDPALVVLDIFMPKVDGLEIIEHLHSRARSVKILAISGNPIPGYDACGVAKAFGAHATLRKPFTAEAFMKNVNALLPTQ